MSYQMISIADIYRARQRIRSHVIHTPLIESPVLSKICGANVYLKLENLQATGSFKPRGVVNRLLALTDTERANGVIGVSTGNHGRAIAAMARELGLPAVICISKNVPEYKRQAILAQGAEIVIGGDSYDEAVLTTSSLARERKLTLIRSFEEPAVTAGHGTIAVELLEVLPDVDTVLIPLAAGGLLIGMAVLLKASNPDTQMVGVAMERGSLLVQSLIAGHIVDFVEEPTLADALMGGLGADPKAIFDIVKPFVDKAATVNEEQIARAMIFALEEHHLVIEGAGAVGIAALMNSRIGNLGKNVVVIVTGGNVDPDIYCRVIAA